MPDRDNLTLVGQGREAEVFLRPDGTILKLMRTANSEHSVRREAAVLATVRRALPIVPAVLGTTVVDGRPGLIMERVPGTDLLSRLARRPWSLRQAATTLGTVHARLHALTAPMDLPDLRSQLRWRLEHICRPECGTLPDQLGSFALSILDRLPDGDAICHGDFHLANIMGTPAHPMVIDWPNASRGDPTADVARTLLLHRLASFPPGSSPVLRPLAPSLAKVIYHRYLTTYRIYHELDDLKLRQWTIVHAAVRIGEPIESERATLISYLESSLAHPI